MAEIKTRDVVSGTIKVLDRSTIAGQRMKDAYVQAREKVEHSTCSSESSGEESAADQVQDGAAVIAQETVYQMDILGRQLLRSRRQANSSTPIDAPQPHQTPDGANLAPRIDFPKKEPNQIRERQILTTHAGPIRKSGSPGFNLVPTVGKGEKSVKTACNAIKTADQAGMASVKTAGAAFRAGQKAAVESARSAHRSGKAAKKVALTARKTAEYSARAAKAIAEATTKLISLFAAGGSTLLILIIVLIVMCFAGILFARDDNDSEILPVSEEVQAYGPVIQKYAREHGIPDHMLLIQAVMMQESRGQGSDPMQCSECGFNTLYPHAPGGITDPEYSINVGIQNLADCLQLAECESPLDIASVKLAIQGYNYGQGYITWAKSKYGEYSKSNAIEFSVKTAERYGWDSYGDMNYVTHVLRYYPLGQMFYDLDTTPLIVEVAASQIGNVGGEPYWRWYGYTERVEWCACFVSWCANQCGYIDAGIIPKFSSCEWGVSWFKQHGQWVDRSITPTPGMLIFFDWVDEESGSQDGRADHVGIVAKVENGRVYTIEGNSGDSCRERSYMVSEYRILGYGIPQY